MAGILASLGGVFLGATMSRQTARDLAQDQREWTEHQAIRERQVEAVSKFDERLLEAMADCPRVQGPAKETAEAIEKCRAKVATAWARGTVIDDPEIVRRVRSLDMLMWIARDDGEMAEHRWSRGTGEPSPMLDPWPISEATAELREALACFQRGVDPPEAKIPTSTELVELGTIEKVREVARAAVRDAAAS